MTQYRLAGHDFGEPSVDAIDPYRALSVGDVFTATFDAATEAALIDAGLIEIVSSVLSASGLPIVKPSGDTIVDTAAINAALVAGDVWLVGDFTTNAPILVPSNRTLALSGSVTLANSSNCNIIRNTNQSATGDSNIYLKGVGRAVLNGNATNQVRQTGVYLNVGVFFMNVSNYRVEDITIGPTNAFAGLQQACTFGRWSRIHLAQDASTTNQDGINIGPGCSNILIEGLTGTTGDDLCSIYAQNTSTSIHPYVSGLTAAQRNVSQVWLRDVNVNVGINVVRLQAGDSSKLTTVRAANIHNRAGSSNFPVIQFGATSFVTTLPSAADMSDITLDGYSGPCARLVACDSNFQQLTVRNVTISGTWSALLGWRNIGNQSGFTTSGPTFNDVKFENVYCNFISGGGRMFEQSVGTIGRVKFANIFLRRATAILNNGATVTFLALDNIKVGSMLGNPFQSTVAETGFADGVVIDAYSGNTARYSGAACAMRLGPSMPVFASADTTPTAVAGSMITCKAGKDPTGGSFASAATYVGDGTAWNRAVTLTNDPAAY